MALTTTETGKLIWSTRVARAHKTTLSSTLVLENSDYLSLRHNDSLTRRGRTMKKRKGAFLLCAVFLFSWLLSSCFIPENFKAHVALHKDGTYTFTYEGILTYATARAAYVKRQLSAKDEAEIKKLEKEFAKDSSFKKVAYLGAGQFKVAYDKKGKITAPFYFMGKDSN